MPFKSQAQRKKFYSTSALHKYIAEFEADTPKRLPKRAPNKRKLLTKRKKK